MTSRWTPGYTAPITLQLVGPQSWTEVPALLCYEATDPFAVRIAFGDVGDEGGAVDADDGGIAWLVSRELLQTGLTGPAGDGDVRVWPAHAATDVLFLHLRAPSGEALFELSRATVAAFLRQTEALVPTGTESELLDLDDELYALLSNGGSDQPGA
jgi:sporulation and cell division protein SsgA